MTISSLRLSTSLPVARAASRRSLITRLLEALMEARMRAALREIERHQHLVPEDAVKTAGYRATAGDDAAFPFTR